MLVRKMFYISYLIFYLFIVLSIIIHENISWKVIIYSKLYQSSKLNRKNHILSMMDNNLNNINKDDDEVTKKVIVYDTSNVNEIVSELISSLSSFNKNNDLVIDNDLTIESLQSKFNQLYHNVKDDTKLNEIEKRLIYTETNLLIENTKYNINSNLNILDEKQNIPMISTKTSLYSPPSGPVLIIYSKGKISNNLYNIAKEFGKSADFRFIQASLLTSIQDSELKYNMRDIKSIIIASDNIITEKKNWLGQIEYEEQSSCLNAKGLKRLLNIALDEMKRPNRDIPIKVVALGKACKETKSIGSMMLSTDTNTDLDDEIKLQCMQRGLSYNIIKVGKVIDDQDEYPKDIKIRSYDNDLNILKELNKDEKSFAQSLYHNPIVFTNSKIIEYNEVTKLSIATQVLMRAVVHPHRNATITVLSNPLTTSIPTELEWEDEFLKLDGPELFRIPLRFASIQQAMMKIIRIMNELVLPTSGLITPIQVEKYNNGIKIIFIPFANNYLSNKEEKAELKRIEETKQLLKNQKNNIRVSGYLSPEEEQKIQEQSTSTTTTSNSISATSTSSTVVDNKKKKPLLEGGLEILFDNYPYRRIRVRRCNLGPKTIIKEESENIIVKAIKQGIIRLDNDYRILLTTNKNDSWRVK